MTGDGAIPSSTDTHGGKGPLRRCGTTLILGTGRPVRVMTLPEVCGHRQLSRAWDACFGFGNEPDDLVVWWPPTPPPPSRN